MYVLVHHDIHDPASFWSTAEKAIPGIPSTMKLHHAMPAKDGTRATCLWEADSIDDVRGFLEPSLGAVSTNQYAEAENRDGVAMPSGVERGTAATA